MQHFRKISAVVVLGAGVLLSSCRLDMHVQPRVNPLAKSDFFPDQRGARPLIEGTVARGELHADTYFYTGKINGNPGDYMPFPVTREVLNRGRERFNIYCSPCHSVLGDGNGFIPSRGFSRKPPSYHTARLEKAPLGYFYDVISNGFGIMSDYSAQIPPQDRWNIVAYIRALQLSQNATKADVPTGQAIPSEPPNFQPIGSGATLPALAPQHAEAQQKEEAK
jgi:mono/diheme cytochrome c family protein